MLVQRSEELFALGLALIEKADSVEGGSPWRRANDYRDGLMIALLAARPLRRDNFTSIEIGRQLLRQASGYLLHFDGIETKNGQPIDAPIPTVLDARIDRYIGHYRPMLERPTGHWAGKRDLTPPGNRLWVSSYGTAMSQGAVYDRLGRKLIGHLKAEHRMDRNYLKGQDGDRINAVLAAAGFNFHLLLRWFAALLRAWIQAWFSDAPNPQPA